jgi:predicted ester cyclase
MSTEQNKTLYRRFVEEVVNKGNLALVDELAAPDFVDHTPLPGLTPDREGYKQSFAMFRAAFPDFHATIEDLVAEGDVVAGRVVTTGTHSGPLQTPEGPVPPTGKAVRLAGMNMVRVVNGKAVETWAQLDVLGMMQQLGLAPAAG